MFSYGPPTEAESFRTRAYVQVRSAARRGRGAQGRNRTTDTAIFSRMLYQLSYLGMTADPMETTAGLSGFGPKARGL